MKRLIIAMLLFAAVNTFAQDVEKNSKKTHIERMTPEERQQKQLQRITAELELNNEQQQQIKQLLAEQTLLNKSRSEHKQRSQAEMKEQRAQLRNKRQENKKMMSEKMKVILNPEQYTTWQTNQEKMEQEIKNRSKNKRNGKV